jgi:hypothetical protein
MTEIDKQYIENRVADWKNRLYALYATVEQCSINYIDVVCKRERTTTMYEELMKKYGVAEETLPLLDMYKNQKIFATFKPIGLWVLGANGRVDVLTESGAYIIVDTSDNRSEPRWEVYSPNNRKKGRMLDCKFIEEIVNGL